MQAVLLMQYMPMLPEIFMPVVGLPMQVAIFTLQNLMEPHGANLVAIIVLQQMVFYIL